jgi:hypothetical protein
MATWPRLDLLAYQIKRTGQQGSARFNGTELEAEG